MSALAQLAAKKQRFFVLLQILHDKSQKKTIPDNNLAKNNYAAPIKKKSIIVGFYFDSNEIYSPGVSPSKLKSL